MDKKKIMITGAKGMLGADVVEVFQRDERYELFAVDIDELDIADLGAVKTALYEEKPDTIVHLAAYTNVDGAEHDQLTCWRVNAEGTKNLAIFAREINAGIIFISTDYVFNGKASLPYEINDHPEPINFYGLSKYWGEQHLATMMYQYKIIRTSWLCGLGGSGKNFIETILSLAKRQDEISVVTDQVGKPTFTFDLATAIYQLLDLPDPGIYHATNEGICSWFEFAEEIINQAGIQGVQINPVTTDKLQQRPAKRPAFSALSTSRLTEVGIDLLPTWQESLKKYIELRSKRGKS